MVLAGKDEISGMVLKVFFEGNHAIFIMNGLTFESLRRIWEDRAGLAQLSQEGGAMGQASAHPGHYRFCCLVRFELAGIKCVYDEDVLSYGTLGTTRIDDKSMFLAEVAPAILPECSGPGAGSGMWFQPG